MKGRKLRKKGIRGCKVRREGRRKGKRKNRV